MTAWFSGEALAGLWPVGLWVDYYSRRAEFAAFLLPDGLAGVVGLLVLAASFYFSIRRRNGEMASFLIWLGWMLSVLDTLEKFERAMGLGSISMAILRASPSSEFALLGLVLPLGLAIPATTVALLRCRFASRRVSALRLASCLAATLDILLVVLFVLFWF